jgi:hypothetical protein
MNGEDFYEEFKDVLRYFGLSWSDKEQVKVYVEHSRLVFEFDNKKCTMEL